MKKLLIAIVFVLGLSFKVQAQEINIIQTVIESKEFKEYAEVRKASSDKAESNILKARKFELDNFINTYKTDESSFYLENGNIDTISYPTLLDSINFYTNEMINKLIDLLEIEVFAMLNDSEKIDLIEKSFNYSIEQNSNLRNTTIPLPDSLDCIDSAFFIKEDCIMMVENKFIVDLYLCSRYLNNPNYSHLYQICYTKAHLDRAYWFTECYVDYAEAVIDCCKKYPDDPRCAEEEDADD